MEFMEMYITTIFQGKIVKPQLLWEAFSHAAITARRLFIHISTTVCITRFSFIQLSELWQRGVIKLAKGSKQLQWDLNPGSLE